MTTPRPAKTRETQNTPAFTFLVPVAVMLVVFMFCGITSAAEAGKTEELNAESAAGTPKEEKFDIEVMNVIPLAKVGETQNGKLVWRKLKKGDLITEGQIIRTGFGGEVELRFDDRGRTTIKSCTKVGFSDIIKMGNTCGSQLRIKYGAINAEIDSTKGKKNDYRVRTAGGTLSARGTGGNIGFQADAGMGIDGKHGTWGLVANNGLKQTIRRGQTGNSKATLSKTLLAEALGSKMGDRFGGLTQKEKQDIATNPPVFPGFPGTPGEMGPRPGSTSTTIIGSYYNMQWSGSGDYAVTPSRTAWSGSGSYYQNGIGGSWSGSGTMAGYSSDGNMAGATLTGSGESINTSTSKKAAWVGRFYANGGTMHPAPTGPGSVGGWSAQGNKFYGKFPNATPSTSTNTTSTITSPALVSD